jgi:hypothetical protein
MARRFLHTADESDISVSTPNGGFEYLIASLESGGGGAPLTRARFVDKGTSVPLADQNGSAVAPFATLAAGLAALAAAFPTDATALLVVAGDYSAEGGGTLELAHTSICGLVEGDSVSVRLPALTMNAIEGGSNVWLANVDASNGIAGAGNLQLSNVQLGVVSGTLSVFSFETAFNGSTFAGDQLVMRESACGFNTISITNNIPVEATSTTFDGTTSVAFGVPGGHVDLDAFAFDSWNRLAAVTITAGALRVRESPITFASPAAVALGDFSGMADHSTVSVGVINDQYLLFRTPPAGAVADGVNIISPAAPLGALLFRQFIKNPAAWEQTTWVIDPAAGNDGNAGTALSPLKTIRELSNRWRGGRLLHATYSVSVLAGDAGKLGRWDVDIGAGVLVTVAGTMTSTAPAALTGVVATGITTNTRGTVSDAAGAFARGQRLRMVSGTQSGAITYTQGGTVAATAVVVGWSQAGNLTPPTYAGFPSPVEPAIGDQYVTDTYSTTLHMGGLFQLRGSGRLVIRDCNFTTDPANSSADIEGFTCTQTNRGTIPINSQLVILACQFDSACFASFLNGGGPINVSQCIFKSSTSVSYGACVAFNECTFTSSLTVGFSAFVQNVTRWTLDGGNVIFKTSFFETNSGSIQAGATALPGAICLEFLPGAFNYWHGGGRLWGPTSGYAVGVRVHAFAGFMWDPSTLPTLTGSTTADCVFLTANQTWAQMLTQSATAPVNSLGGLVSQGPA